MPSSVYPKGKYPRLLDRRLGVQHVDLDAVVRAKILLLPEIKPGCPARRKWMHYYIQYHGE